MKSIGTRFSLAVGACTIIFSAIILHRTWSSTREYTEELAKDQGRLALEFDLAIRAYVRETVRPVLEQHLPKDEFIVKAMSASYVARQVFEKVDQNFPEYLLIKFSSDNPRNPANQAGPGELDLLRYFREHPGVSRISKRLNLDGKSYFACVGVMRVEQKCLQCHGEPGDAPKSLLKMYGDKGGFHYKVGDVAGLDVIGIPTAKMHAQEIANAQADVLTTALWLTMLFGTILFAFRHLVTKRLMRISKHFQEASLEAGDALVSPVPAQGNDEISTVARSFNTLAMRLRTLYESLEERVHQRTDELRKGHQTLKHLLQSSDHERQLIAYEIHDSLAQQLAAATMSFEAYDHLKDDDPNQAASAYRTGVAMVHQSLTEARRLISGVRPPILDECGVVAAIAHLILGYQAEPNSPEIDYFHDVDFGRLAPVVENAIYRIVQESLTNALKHSQSRQIAVRLLQRRDRVCLEIQDWGVGFTPTAVEAESCFGLEGIHQRARLLGGSSRIESAPGQGTHIFVDLPMVPKELLE